MALLFDAEAGGFEPPIPCGILAFQASALGHYATPPWRPYDTKLPYEIKVILILVLSKKVATP